MNNNVLVTVHGLQHEIDDKEGIQTKQTGNYRLVAGKHVISYKEYFKDENVYEQTDEWIEDFISQAPPAKRDEIRQLIKENTEII